MDGFMAGAEDANLAPDRLCRLRQAIENIQHFQFDRERPPLALGAADADSMLGGGLSFGALHETAPERPGDFGAACGFTLALACLAAKDGGETLWIQTDFARYEGGALYGTGFDLFGLLSQRLLVLRARRAVDALFAMEEALKCRAVASVIAELPDDSADLTATRRLSLAARDHCGLGLLLRHRSSSMPSAAMTRWNVAAASGPRDDFGGIGITNFLLSLVKNRRGPCGRWNVAWNHHACGFVPQSFADKADSLGVAAASADGPPLAAFA
jgi:protein ImuA